MRLALSLPCLALAALFPIANGACDRTAPEPHPADPKPNASATPPAPPPPPTSIAPLSDRISRPAPAHLVAIGDLHGDLDAARKALRLAGAIDAKDAWIGDKMIVVQTGDEIDRGDDDRKILDLIEKLRGDAKKTGGELIAMSGNHEVMNEQLDFRYVTAGAFAAFSEFTPKDASVSKFAGLEPSKQGRAAAFAPGGVYATMLAERPVVMKVGDTVFAHGGVLPKHVTYGLDKLNDEMRDWLLGKRPNPPAIVVSDDGPIWTRAYSESPSAADCAKAAQALSMLGAKRMVVGHTVQHGGVTEACDGKVWRIDVGMARYFGGPVQDLSIDGDAVKVKKQDG